MAGGFMYVWSVFKETTVYQSMTEWGMILDFWEVIMGISFSRENIDDIMYEQGHGIYAGMLFGELAIIVLIFAACVWLLDHKVEV